MSAIETLIGAVRSGSARARFAAIKALRNASEQAPDSVYPHFEFFVDLLAQKNQILRWNAILVLGNLARVDAEGKLDRMLESYLAPISGPVMITAGNTIHGAASIARAKPYLAEVIAGRILEVERANYATPECRNVAIGHAIQALATFVDELEDRRAVVDFAQRQLNNRRPATQRKAERLLAKIA